MAADVPLGFSPEAIRIPLDRILPLRALPSDMRSTIKYRRIAASIRELGLIEPLNVYPQKGSDGCFSLLDGHIRLDIVKQLGWPDILCLVATEDDSYSYNKNINIMSPIQEHFMIMKAIKSGVSEERIAATLDINVSRVKEKQNLLAGICPEAVALIKNRRISANALRELKRVMPMRQIEMVDLMIMANNFSLSYAKCLYSGTTEEQKLGEHRPRTNHGLEASETVKMQRELQTLSREAKTIHETHGENVLNLVLCGGYLKKLLENTRVCRYLGQKFPDLLAEFRRIIDAPELDGAGA